MSDILLQWNFESGFADWDFYAGDIQEGATGLDDLTTAVLVSIFTDRVASPDFVPPDGTGDLRGWWADSYNQVPLGSRLWQLYRSKITSDTGPLLQARGFIQEALQWLIDDGIAATVTVTTSWSSKSTMHILVVITEPVTNATKTFNFSYFWK